MKNLELYIKNDSGVDERVDLFDFEAVNLSQVIKDVKDIGKIFTDYSQSFKVPASANNNRIFQHYYNFNIQDGYDGRMKRDAVIKIAGADFRFGKIRLDDVDMRINQPFSYKIVFFGSSVALTDILGKDELSDLDYLNRFNHDYNQNTVKNGLITGLEYDDTTESMITGSNADILYSFISCYSQYYYSSNASDNGNSTFDPPSRNLHRQGSSTTNGIEHTDLKPSIKIRHIINAIEAKYNGLFFDKTYFDSAPFNELYMLLHRDKGAITDSIAAESVFTQEDFGVNLDISQITTGLEPINSIETSYVVKFIITPITGTGPYDIRIVDTLSGNILESANGLDGNGEVIVGFDVLSSVELRNWNLNFFITTQDGSTLATYNANLSIIKRERQLSGNIVLSSTFTNYPSDSTQYSSPNSPETMASKVILANQIPKMKVIDFLQSIFKMFNLTAYFERDTSLPQDTKIIVKSLNEYYSTGKTIDVSKYINISSGTISRPPTYSEINFKYSKPSTFGIINQNTLLNDEFGDLTRNNRDLSVFFNDGGKYDIKLGFEHMLFERFSDENNLTIRTPIQTGWLVDDNEKPVKTKPIIHYAVPTTVDDSAFPFAFTGSGQSNITTYFRPSNVSEDGLQTINFNEENDEFTGLENKNSLYQVFYSTYIQKAFSKFSRLVKLEAKLPLNILLNYELNDVFRVNSLDYNINKIQTNLLTGKSVLELINGNFADSTRPSPPTDVTSTGTTSTTIDITWTIPVGGVIATNYRVYIDGTEANYGSITYTGGNPDTPTATLRNLVDGQSYTVEVTSLSQDGVESYKSAPLVTSTTLNGSTPSDPTNLILVSKTSTSINVSWTASVFGTPTGNNGYSIYLDGVFLTNVTTNSHSITGLSSSTSHDIKVKAFDSAAPSDSGFSNTLTVVTNNALDLEPPSIPQDLETISKTSSSILFGWSASTDNIGVAGYKVYVDGAYLASTTNTSYSVTGLSSATSYNLNVLAYDANDNESALSVTLKETTN